MIPDFFDSETGLEQLLNLFLKPHGPASLESRSAQEFLKNLPTVGMDVRVEDTDSRRIG